MGVMAGKDYYEILGVPRTSSEDEIKVAYRKLVRQHHPDTNKSPDAEKKMAEINEAYTILSNKEKRAQYDQFGSVQPPGSQGGYGYSTYPGGGFNFNEDVGSFADVFETFFGGGRTRSAATSNEGADLRAEATITLEEAFTGKKITLEIPRYDKCPDCNGTGAAKGTHPTKCAICNGKGKITRNQSTIFGTFQTATTCPECKGEGTYVKNKCPRCLGQTVVKVTHHIEVDIPAGIEDNMRVRVRGQGDTGKHGGSTGDLYVVIHIRDHKIFERDGPDLHSQVTVSMYEAALGADISVFTIDGKDKITVKPGTQPGDTMVLKGRGMPLVNSQRKGDHVISFRVEIPKKLTAKEKQALEDISGLTKKKK
jgi:molecular chaperone DnaJ